MIELNVKSNGKRVSPELYGIFLEDINYACDGGLNANLVNNYSFDGVYFNSKKKKSVDDPLRYWHICEGEMESGNEKSIGANSKYARLTVQTGTKLENLGYNGGGANKDRCAMYIAVGKTYQFRCQLRSDSFDGNVSVIVVNSQNVPLTDCAVITKQSREWHCCELLLTGVREDYGKLVISFDGSGQIDLDCVELYDSDFWNKDDPKWKHGKLRRDLMETLKALKPAFVRFPGGCIVEGKQRGNEYDWKDTVGPLSERKAKYSLWAERVSDGGYCQSYQIGFYEYFCMCEDLGAKPLPTLFAGINCQMRSMSRIKTGSTEFYDYVVKNYIDLIEFAIGDPKKSKWAKIRSDMGHPTPFELDRIGIGNENMGKDYIRKFEIIRKAITEKYPDILCVMCAGVLPFDFAIKPFWKHAAKSNYPFLIDEHCYHEPNWFFEGSKKFDSYPRGSAKVYFGEYAANGLMAGKMTNDANANRYITALSEAAFLTGVERNCDVVEMTSYAPLFNLSEAAQWPHNLIAFNPKTVMKTTNYFVQQMFANHIGSSGMDIEGSLPPKIYSSATQDDSTVYIKLVNGTENVQKVSLTIPNAQEVAQLICLQSDNTAAKNELSYTGDPIYRVEPKKAEIPIENGRVILEAAPFGIYVITAKKTK